MIKKILNIYCNIHFNKYFIEFLNKKIKKLHLLIHFLKTLILCKYCVHYINNFFLILLRITKDILEYFKLIFFKYLIIFIFMNLNIYNYFY